jgi:hypothetical protein
LQLGAVAVDIVSAGTVGQIIKGAAAQTANLQEWQNSAGTALSFITPSGSGSFKAIAIGKTPANGRPALEVVGTVSGTTVLGSNGITTKVIAGACSDSNAQATDGTVCIDSSGGRIYFRYSGVWHYAAQTAGFQIPSIIRNGKNETEGLSPGDLVVGRLDERMKDGALHGIWEKFDVLTSVSKVLREHPELITAHAAAGSSPTITTSDIKDLVIQGSLTVVGPAYFLGDVTIHGILGVSTKQAGTVTVIKGTAGATVVYSQTFRNAPIVTATPQGVPSAFWGVVSATNTGFTIRLSTPMDTDLTFGWFAVSVTDQAPVVPTVSTPQAVTATGSTTASQSSGTGSTNTGTLIDFPIDERGYPISSDALWNSCIRHQAMLNPDGSTVDCNRVYLGHRRWEHPDLGVTFVFNDERNPFVIDLPKGYRIVTVKKEISVSASGTGTVVVPAKSTGTGASVNAGTGAAL